LARVRHKSASAAPIQITPAMQSAQKTAAEPISLTTLMTGSICGVVRSHNFSMLVFSSSTARTASKHAINSARRKKSGVNTKETGRAAAKTPTSRRKARSVRKALARPEREAFRARNIWCLLKGGHNFDGGNAVRRRRSDRRMKSFPFSLTQETNCDRRQCPTRLTKKENQNAPSCATVKTVLSSIMLK